MRFQQIPGHEGKVDLKDTQQKTALDVMSPSHRLDEKGDGSGQH